MFAQELDESVADIRSVVHHVNLLTYDDSTNSSFYKFVKTRCGVILAYKLLVLYLN